MHLYRFIERFAYLQDKNLLLESLPLLCNSKISSICNVLKSTVLDASSSIVLHSLCFAMDPNA